jgi:hypothetical protein
MRWMSIWEAGVERGQQSEAGELIDLAEAARREMQAARAQFEEVHDPDLVDHAIYRMQAAERHYMFLLREARR